MRRPYQYYPIAVNARNLFRGFTHIAALRAEEMAHMPLRAARYNDLSLDWRLAALAAGAEELVVVQVAVEPHSFIAVIRFGDTLAHLDVLAVPAPPDTVEALGTLVLGLRIEGYALEALAAVVADETLRMEACAGGTDGTTGNRKSALVTESNVAAD